MPRTGPRRPQVAVRLSEQGIAALDRIATETGTLRSDVVRALLAAALANPATLRAARQRLTDA